MIGQLASDLQAYLSSGSAFAFIAAFLGGVLISFTPCVYPLIPVTISVIGAQKTQSRGKAFLLSLCYVTGVALTYSALGAAAALTGTLFGSIQTNPITYLIVANVFILLGLSALEVFDLSFLFSFGVKAGAKNMTGKGLLGSFIIGMASGLVVGPCTAPALGVLLAFVAAKQRVFFGMSLLFSFAMGMGLLLIALGTFTGLLTSLPKAGGWTMRIKKAFGLMLILIGEYFLVQAGKMLF